jgi:hypothetical protein
MKVQEIKGAISFLLRKSGDKLSTSFLESLLLERVVRR